MLITRLNRSSELEARSSLPELKKMFEEYLKETEKNKDVKIDVENNGTLSMKYNWS